MVPALRPSPPLVTRLGLRLMVPQLDPHRCSSVPATLLSAGCIAHKTHTMGLHRPFGLRSSTRGQALPRPSELRMLSRPCSLLLGRLYGTNVFPHPVDSVDTRVARVFRDVPGLQALKLNNEETSSRRPSRR